MKNEDLQKIAQILEDSLTEFNNKSLEPSTYFIVGLISRAERIIKSLVKLNEPRIDEDIEFSMGLIFRTLATDFICFLYFKSFIDEKREMEFLKFKVNSILSGGPNSLINNVNNFLLAGVFTNEESTNLLESVKKKYNLDSDFKKDDSITGSQFKYLILNNHTSDDLLLSYDCYVRYSKYEHFSKVYYDMIVEPLDDRIKSIQKYSILIGSYASKLVYTLRDLNKNSNLL
jgi:hypothetical protein